jgi:hypothetical protein
MFKVGDRVKCTRNFIRGPSKNKVYIITSVTKCTSDHHLHFGIDYWLGFKEFSDGKATWGNVGFRLDKQLNEIEWLDQVRDNFKE